MIVETESNFSPATLLRKHVKIKLTWNLKNVSLKNATYFRIIFSLRHVIQCVQTSGTIWYLICSDEVIVPFIWRSFSLVWLLLFCFSICLYCFPWESSMNISSFRRDSRDPRSLLRIYVRLKSHSKVKLRERATSELRSISTQRDSMRQHHSSWRNDRIRVWNSRFKMTREPIRTQIL